MSPSADPTRPALIWFRNGLWLADHAALCAAMRGGRKVPALFMLNEVAAGPWAPGGASRSCLHHSLAALRT